MQKKRPSIRKLLIICLCLGLLSEASKILGSIEIVPIVEPAVENGVGNAVNYFSSYNNPLGIPMATKGQWLLYLLIRIALALILITLVQLPLRKKDRTPLQRTSLGRR